ncbi:helix-turn-helix domain-containing protein [Beggiatoa leptomitoformis]|uniref:Bacteriophage CI repressor N-terminal domain-containing protein n=1 Tax=Beggiatoa leptomitoformis TaxID=288004 RepID=A0A2N9YFR9_9GAMM|nr:helix-turn-helix domain-containing protein [Beggiatoa leptomitoformis]ALG68341.1 hypothetical protein AL038_12245 [Beggiatoa leptomitoformis]AUI69342.1 hypothetical protein BLE401_12020 [Beggiatoa leptomitoformis]
MSEAIDVLNRLATVLQAKHDADLARKLEVSTSTIATWKARDTIPYKICVDIARREKVSLDWLLNGEEFAIANTSPKMQAIMKLIADLDEGQQGKIFSLIQDEKRYTEMREQINQLNQLIKESKTA